MIARSYKGNRRINITGVDKINLKCDCINGSIVNGVQEPILYNFALDQPPGYKIYKKPIAKFFLKEISKSFLSHVTFCLEDYDHKPVDFKSETVSVTCQLIKI